MAGRGRSRNEATNPERVKATLETQTKAAQLRASGATFREIGTALGIDHTWARRLVLRALDTAAYENADLMRTQEGERLDRLQRAVWVAACGGDIRAVNAVLRIMDRRARLFGLDVPARVELHTDADDQIRAFARALGVELPERVTDGPGPAAS